MCLILVAWQAHARWPLVVAANRDERHDRPTDAAGWWPDATQLCAGRDGTAGGTWLGMTADGRFAALTNHRDLRRSLPASAPSRGALVRDFLLGTQSAGAYLADVATRAGAYAPFNLLAGDHATLACLSSTAPPGQALQVLGPGVYGLSNAVLDTPWPKVVAGRTALATALATVPDEDPEPLEMALFTLLADRRTAPPDQLPDTGLAPARERALSASMIIDPDYGTRCATVVLRDSTGAWTLTERSFDPSGRLAGLVRFQSPCPDRADRATLP